MSDGTRARIAVLQHRRRQHAARARLAEVSDAVGEPRHEPIDAETSLRLQTELRATLAQLRARGRLHTSAFKDAEQAVAAAVAHLDRSGTDAVFEVAVGASYSGFFAGPLTAPFVRACLQFGHETVAAVTPTLDAGVLLDVVLDDPLDGNFFEVEWW